LQVLSARLIPSIILHDFFKTVKTHTRSLLLTSLLTLTTSALPAHPQPNTDQCSPTIPIPSDPEDTCPHQDQFGITQIPLPSSLSVTTDWNICNPLADQLCETEQVVLRKRRRWRL